MLGSMLRAMIALTKKTMLSNLKMDMRTIRFTRHLKTYINMQMKILNLKMETKDLHRSTLWKL